MGFDMGDYMGPKARDDIQYAAALDCVYSGYAALRPPRRLTVSQGAADILKIQQPGSSGGAWSSEETPYMVEPMDMLASRAHEAEVFIGPARTGKTLGLLLGWLCHNVVNDPGDMLFMQMTKEKAREFSKTDVDRAMLYSTKVKALKSSRATDSNTFDTMFRHGMWLRIAWPTVANVSGSTYRYVAITDLDRMDNAENVDGEGPLFNLALKRTTTFLSRGMCLVETSPGIEQLDPNWEPVLPHEAPPVTGGLGIYNRSDRRRWYWKCPNCAEWFEAKPGLSLFKLPPDEELVQTIREINISEMAEKFGARIFPPCCGIEIPASLKNSLNRNGRWVPEGQHLDSEDNLVGTPFKRTYVGYWLGGVAATYQKWQGLIERHLQGLYEYAMTGSEQVLKTTVNTDQGMPYISMHLRENMKMRKTPQERAEVDMRRYYVPAKTRCLLAQVDVQGGSTGRFVVQLHAVGPHRETWLVDRFEIRESKREGMGSEFAPIDPAAYAEDWDILTEKLLMATWKTQTPGREIQVLRLVVDSGGEDGVTARAYAWWRRVKKLDMGARVRLYKGGTVKSAPPIKESFVGQRNKNDKGDIPLLVCNTNLLSDMMDADLRRDKEGPGYVHLPAPKHPTMNPNGWLPMAFFDELKGEQRDEKGIWYKVRKRQETFDLMRMLQANMLSLGLDKIKDWDNVSTYLAPLEKNAMVISREDRQEMKEDEVISQPEPSKPVRVAAAPRPRRVARSPYMGR